MHSYFLKLPSGPDFNHPGLKKQQQKKTEIPYTKSPHYQKPKIVRPQNPWTSPFKLLPFQLLLGLVFLHLLSICAKVLSGQLFTICQTGQVPLLR